MSDSIAPYSADQDRWYHFRSKGIVAPFSSNSGSSSGISADTYRGPTVDSISKGPLGPAFDTFRVDSIDIPPVVPTILSAEGVSVFIGPDGGGAAAMIVRPPQFEAVPPWLAEVRRKEEIEKSVQRSARNAPVVPGSPGWLSVLGRFVLGPVSRMTSLFQQQGTRFVESILAPTAKILARPIVAFVRLLANVAGHMIRFVNRIVPPLWAPIEWTLIQAGNWIDKQYQRVQPYVKRGIEQALGFGKRVLDTLILEAPKAAWAIVKSIPEFLGNWINGLADRSHSR